MSAQRTRLQQIKMFRIWILPSALLPCVDIVAHLERQVWLLPGQTLVTSPQTGSLPDLWDLSRGSLSHDALILSPLAASISLAVCTPSIRACGAWAEQSFFCLSVEIHTQLWTRNTLRTCVCVCVSDSSLRWLLCCAQKRVVASHRCLRGVNEGVAKETAWAASPGSCLYRLTA